MSRIRVVLMALVAMAFTVGTAHAVDLNGKKGIGFAQSIGGPSGFAFDYGLGNLHLEALLGVPILMPEGGETGYTLNLGLGAHFQALRTDAAAWTIGGRVNIGLDQPPVKDADSVTQFGIDIPMRVYWFPNKNISLHVEGGIAIQLEGDKGSVFGTPGEGTYISFLNPISAIGMTFWW